MLGQKWVSIKYSKRSTGLEILLHSSSISLELRCAFAAQMVQQQHHAGLSDPWYTCAAPWAQDKWKPELHISQRFRD